jgi:hypothetical protein
MVRVTGERERREAKSGLRIEKKEKWPSEQKSGRVNIRTSEGIERKLAP